MARRNRRGYQEYRGRRGTGSLILKIIIVLLALLLLACILFAVFLGKYVEYTDNGVRLNLPWDQAQESEEPYYSAPVVIITDDPSPDPSPTGRLQAAIGVVEVTAGQVTDGSAAQAVAEAGGSGLVVEVKDAYGRLAWRAQVERAATLGVNAADDSFAQAVAALAETDDLYLVARVCCFRDQALAAAGIGGPLMTRGGNVWYDSGGLRWVSPASQEVTEYLAALCSELAQMGFDEILLDCSGYPDFGEVHVLATDDQRPEDRTAPVAAFYGRVAAALEGSGVVLSIQASEQMTQTPGDEVYSGITPSVLAEYAGRVWLPEELSAEDYAALLSAAGMEEAGQRLVVENGTKESGSWYRTG